MTETKPSQRFTREITALVGLPFMIWVIGWAPLPFYIVLATLVSALALYEFLILGEKKGYPVHKLLSILLMLFLMSAFLLTEVSVEVAIFAILLIIPGTYVFSRTDLAHALPASAVCVLSTLYIGMLGGALLRLRLDFGDVGAKLVFFLFIAVWISDAGAYYVGRKWGRTKLSPRVSPKKTLEGALGGVVASIIAAAVMHFTFFPEFPLLHALVAAAILAFAGLVGDLAESMWKRSAEVKDSGTFLPGHGGFLDRIDSIFFTAPILYSYWFLLSNSTRLTLG